MKKTFFLLCFLFILCNFIDVVTTNHALDNGAIEGNPVASFLFETFGFLMSIILFKITGVILVLICVNIVFKRDKVRALIVLSFIDGVVFMCILNNIMMILLMS